MSTQPEIDLWCPRAVASTIELRRNDGLFTALVSVTVRLDFNTERVPAEDARAPAVTERHLENALQVSMDELTSWPDSAETLKRAEGVRVALPHVVARLRVHRVEGPREPLQDLPLQVQTLAVDQHQRLADVGLTAEVSLANPNAKLIALVGIALGEGRIRWPSRDQVVAETALSGGQLHTTQAAETRHALPTPSAPPRRHAGAKNTRPPPPPRAGRKALASVPAIEPSPPTTTAATRAPERAEAITLNADNVLSIDPCAADTQSIRLDGTVVLSNDDRPPPSQRMTLTVVNDTSLAAWTVPWRLQGKHSLTVVVKATCDIPGDGRAATVRRDTDAPRGDVFNLGDPAATLIYPSDNALLKHRADITLVGHAYAPSGRASRSTVCFRFGSGANSFERTISVFGPREWRAQTPSPPQLFRRIPLIYERAFGGLGFKRNPVGVGYGDGHRAHFLPSLEDPALLLQTPSDHRRPACTAPISPTWERRWRRVGRTSRGRLEEKWDALPDDFNWEFFQCAPQAQQLDYLSGDEPFEVLGVRPGDAPLTGQLPAMRAICTATSARGVGAVALNLDTVLIDADTMTLHILWRGLLSVTAPHAPEISALTISTSVAR